MTVLPESWLLLALLAAAFWALSCVVDVCLVGTRVLRNPLEAAVTMALFSVVPLAFLLPNATEWGGVRFAPIGTAALAGFFYFLHIYFNFRALFTLNDSLNTEIFNNLTVLFVPVLAFLMLGERLEPTYYVALGLALCGVLTLLRKQLAALKANLLVCLLQSVLCMSLAMVLQASALADLDYMHAAIVFSAACLLPAVLLMALRQHHTVRIGSLCRRFGVLFAGVQLLDIAAVLISQRATSIAPSVTLVAVAECTLPAFIMIISGVYLLYTGAWGASPDRLRDSLALQTDRWGTKILSMTLIAGAIALMQLGPPGG
ncbi:MAG: EamA family transporter [Gammaproteobacteria bacterium]|nr:EamA family transporter [Gammaproteobacteria bacterium]MDH5619271.1 EamA family transporter [Gammaproteobacteria bacterium]